MPVQVAALAAHPVVAAIAAFFLGAAGGAVGAGAVAAVTKRDQDPAKPALPSTQKATVSGADELGAASEPTVTPVASVSDPVAVVTQCDWRRVKTADLTQELVSMYRAQLKEPVGTAKIVRHGGKRVLLETVSRETDPDFTRHERDVRGWIREGSGVTVTVALNGTSADDLGLSVPTRIVDDEKEFAIDLKPTEPGKFGIPIRGSKISGPPSEPPDLGKAKREERMDPRFIDSVDNWSPTRVLPAAGAAYRTAFGPSSQAPVAKQGCAPCAPCPPCAGPSATPPPLPPPPAPPRVDASFRVTPPHPPPPPPIDAEASVSTR